MIKRIIRAARAFPLINAKCSGGCESRRPLREVGEIYFRRHDEASVSFKNYRNLLR